MNSSESCVVEVPGGCCFVVKLVVPERCSNIGDTSSLIYVLFLFRVLCDEHSVGFSGFILVFFFISTSILFFESLFGWNF